MASALRRRCVRPLVALILDARNNISKNIKLEHKVTFAPVWILLGIFVSEALIDHPRTLSTHFAQQQHHRVS